MDEQGSITLVCADCGTDWVACVRPDELTAAEIREVVSKNSVCLSCKSPKVLYHSANKAASGELLRAYMKRQPIDPALANSAIHYDNMKRREL